MSSQTVLEHMLAQLKSPDREYSPAPFWFFNDRFDREKVRRQLEDYVEKGVEAFVLHPRIGIPEDMPYLSEAYFEAVVYIVDTAASLNMKVILYDEGQYPSGSAHGEVVRSNPSFASVGIILRDQKEGKILCELADGRYLVEDYSKGTIRGIHFGEDDGEPGAPASADILNPQAVDKFIELTHEQYYRHLKKYFGNVIIGFFTDEPCILGRNAGEFRPWTPGFEEEFCREGGKLEELEALFTGGENASVKLYHRLIKKRLMDVFYTKLSGWCADHGIAFMGHPETSDDMDEELFFHIPGQDLIMRRVAPETGGLVGLDSVQAKCSSDIALMLNRRRNANECFGVCTRDGIPWYMTAEDMKWFIDWLGVRGVNLFIPHAFYYSVEGQRSGERPPDVGPNNIWWPYYRQFSDYMKRISYAMTDIRSTSGIAVLCRSNHLPVDEVAGFYRRQIGFHYLPTALLKDCRVEEGRLYCGSLVFDQVYNLAGAEYDAFIDGVKQIYSSDEAAASDFITARPCPGLRVNHVIKDGLHFYLMFLEEGEDIETEVSLSVSGKVYEEDLWSGTYRAVACKTEEAAHRCSFTLRLKYGETRLLIVQEGAASEESFAEDAVTEGTYLGDFTELLKQTSETDNTREYRAVIQLGQVLGNEYLDFTGEEMAECWCNGSFAGVSFWNRHSFEVGGLLRPGTNEIRVRMTGNAANIYEGAGIPFGVFKK